MPAGLWWKAPGPPASPPRAADLCHGDWKHHPRSARLSAGRPRSGGVNAIDSSSHEANTPTWSPWPWPVSWQDACGLLPSRFRSHPQAKIAHDSTTNAEGLPTCIERDAAPVWCHPRPREKAGRGDSSLEGGRHPTDARQVAANPWIVAGSTVGSDWLRLFRCTEDKSIMMT